MSDSLFTPSVYLRGLFLTMLTLRFLDDHRSLMSGGLICCCIVTSILSIFIHLVVANIVCIRKKPYRTSLSKSRKRNISQGHIHKSIWINSLNHTLYLLSTYLFVALILWINTSEKRPQRLVSFANMPDTF